MITADDIDNVALVVEGLQTGLYPDLGPSDAMGLADSLQGAYECLKAAEVIVRKAEVPF